MVTPLLHTITLESLAYDLLDIDPANSIFEVRDDSLNPFHPTEPFLAPKLII